MTTSPSDRPVPAPAFDRPRHPRWRVLLAAGMGLGLAAAATVTTVRSLGGYCLTTDAGNQRALRGVERAVAEGAAMSNRAERGGGPGAGAVCVRPLQDDLPVPAGGLPVEELPAGVPSADGAPVPVASTAPAVTPRAVFAMS